MLATRQRVEAMRNNILKEMEEKFTMNEDEKEKARKKWHGGELVERLQEPPKEPEIVAKCPFGHKVVSYDGPPKAWVCGGTEKWKPPCTHGSHDTPTHFTCTSFTCSWSGCCPDHYTLLLTAAEKRQSEDFMTSYIVGRYTTPGAAQSQRLSPQRTHQSRLPCRYP